MFHSNDTFKIVPKISLEFTSPSNPSSEKNILTSCDSLRHFGTEFSCVNFGGDVISPDRAMMVTRKLKYDYQMPVIGYLRRSNIPQDTFNQIAETYYNENITTIFLTEGRRLNTTSITTEHHNSLIDAVIALKEKKKFKIFVEARPEYDNSEIDLIKNLVDIGIDEIITRFSFNTDSVLRFIEKLDSKTNLPPIRIGLMPIENPSQTFLTAHLLNVPVTDALQKLFSHYSDNENINISLGTHLLLMQVQSLIKLGFYKFHIRFGRSHEPIEALCRYFGIDYNPPYTQTETKFIFDRTLENEKYQLKINSLN